MSNTSESRLLAASTPDPGVVDYPDDARDRYRRDGLWNGRTLPAELVAAARTHPDHVALVTPETSLTYSEIYRSAAALATGLLHSTELEPADAVMFQMGNVAETPVAYLACLLAGLRPVCSLPQHGEREIDILARHVGAKGLFVQADFGDGHLTSNAKRLVASGAVDVVVSFRGEPFEGAVSAADLESSVPENTIDTLPFRALDPSQIAVFQLSGGTTGLPKIAPRLHEEYTYNARAWATEMGWGPGSVVLYPLPIMHNAGVVLGLHSTLLSGATLVLPPSAEPGLLLDLIRIHQPVAIPLVPPALAIRLLEDPRSREVDFSGLTDFVVGGQKLPVEFAERLRDELGIRIRQKFGMAEGLFTVTPREAGEEVRFHTVGQPISPADEVLILRPGSTEQVPDGQVGELCARGPYTIRGYYRAEAHNAASFTPDGFYRTGDLARAQSIDGTLVYTIEGRIKDVINRGAEKIHAEEVEELILRHPSVANAALVAMSDRVLGERACVYLVLEPNSARLDVASLAAFLTSQGLAKYKLPERVEIAESLPLTNVGKLSKKALRADLNRKLEAEHTT
jgi:2,3-dihydroxybenzoate-AMP ligase